MQFTKPIDIDSKFSDELWNKVKDAGGFYSIGDGSSEHHFKQMLYEADMVLEIPGGYIRVEMEGDKIELHPIIFSSEPFHKARLILNDVAELFKNKTIYCIIPSRMRAAKKLALLAGMSEIGVMVRGLSGVNVVCSIFVRR